MKYFILFALFINLSVLITLVNSKNNIDISQDIIRNNFFEKDTFLLHFTILPDFTKFGDVPKWAVGVQYPRNRLSDFGQFHCKWLTILFNFQIK